MTFRYSSRPEISKTRLTMPSLQYTEYEPPSSPTRREPATSMPSALESREVTWLRSSDPHRRCTQQVWDGRL